MLWIIKLYRIYNPSPTLPLKGKGEESSHNIKLMVFFTKKMVKIMEQGTFATNKLFTDKCLSRRKNAFL
jgi:hypothetical protein